MLWRRRSFKSKILGSNIFWIENDDQYRETQEFVKSKKKDTLVSILSLIAIFPCPQLSADVTEGKHRSSSVLVTNGVGTIIQFI